MELELPDCDLEAIVTDLLEGAKRPGGRSRPAGPVPVSEPAIAGAIAGAVAVGGPGGAGLKRRVEAALLDAGACPRRYLRNLGVIGAAGQARLLRAKVGVAGAGGLGGNVLEHLARVGVGRLVILDPDVASDDNLNRQLLSTEAGLGRAKVEAAVERLAAINSATGVEAHQVAGDESIFSEVFTGVDVVVDALDNRPARFALLEATRGLGVPLVHGAIAGMSGQVTTIFPDDPGLEVIYGPPGERQADDREREAGNLSPTPAIIAAWQVQEVVKLITGVGQPLRHRLLVIDALSNYVGVVEL